MNIWFAELPLQEENNGVQQGSRPVIIIQNDIGNLHSPTVLVMVGTKKQKNNLPTHVKLDSKCGLSTETVFMAEQQMTISKSQLKFFIGNVPKNKVHEVERAIRIQDGLMEPFNIGYVQETINAIMEIDGIISSETEMLIKVRDRLIKELEEYCSGFGYNYETLLNRFYIQRGVMCG